MYNLYEQINNGQAQVIGQVDPLQAVNWMNELWHEAYVRGYKPTHGEREVSFIRNGETHRYYY